jgi:hypothetical protein
MITMEGKGREIHRLLGKNNRRRSKGERERERERVCISEN